MAWQREREIEGSELERGAVGCRGEDADISQQMDGCW